MTTKIKLNPRQVLRIRALVKEGVLQKDMVRAYEVSKTTISQIVNRKTWRDI